MKFGKKLERLLLAEMGVCLIVLLLSMSGRCSSMAILLSTLFQIFMIIYIIVVLVHPLQAYARILEHLNKTEFEREELRMAHLDALAKYPDIQVIDGGIDNDNVETAQSQAAAVLAANPDLTGYLNCDACGSGVAAAIEEKGMQDKVTFVAMDNLIEILDYVKTGTITATSSTLPQEQGMYAVLMAYQAAQGMPLPANVDTGIGRITADNIDEWIETVSAK